MDGNQMAQQLYAIACEGLNTVFSNPYEIDASAIDKANAWFDNHRHLLFWTAGYYTQSQEPVRLYCDYRLQRTTLQMVKRNYETTIVPATIPPLRTSNNLPEK